ncbi:MAG: hypothetical protein GX102_01290 [Porphyromonadaceae bacterium]|nr:hypothetical protein [Porphyromonadaceae bacterium]
MGVGAFGVAIGVQNQLWDYAVRTNFKSARKWSEFNSLKPNQKNFRYNHTLGKTGNNFLKVTKGLGYIGAGVNVDFESANAFI